MWTALIRLTFTCLKTEGSTGPRKKGGLCQMTRQGGCFWLCFGGCLSLRLGSGLGRNSSSPCLLNHESQGEDRKERTGNFHAAN